MLISLTPITLGSGAQIPVSRNTVTGTTHTGPIPVHLQAEYSAHVVARVRAFREAEAKAEVANV